MGVAEFYDSKRVRAFKGVFYPDSESYDYIDVMRRIAKRGAALFILHDRDVDDEGDLKKEHYHFVCRWTVGAAAYRSGFASSVGLKKEDVLPVYGRDSPENGNCLSQSLLYLTHRGYLDKYQYLDSDIDIAFDPDMSLISLYFTHAKNAVFVEDEEGLELIISFIQGSEYRVFTADLLRYCSKFGLLNIARKYSSYINNMIREHNDLYFLIRK